MFRKGQLSWKRSLLDDFRFVIMPALVDELQFIPIPTVEYEDRQWQVRAENIILTTANIIPDIVEVKVLNDLVWNPRGNRDDNGEHVVELFLFAFYALVTNNCCV